MHILLIADGRSPTTRSWLQAVGAAGHRASLASSYPCAELPGLEHFDVLPLAFAGVNRRAGNDVQLSAAKPPAYGLIRPLLLRLRHQLGPLTLNRAAARLATLCAQWQPDLVHGLRIPFEGMLAARAPAGIPVAASIWGNDLTLHAGGSLLMASETRRTLQRADGLLADTHRDLLLAARWGLRQGTPRQCLPGSGGVDLAALAAAEERDMPLPPGWLKPGDLLVINPRGLRPGSLRTDVFFKALPAFLKACPPANVACAAMQEEPEAERLLAGILRRNPELGGRILLLPHLEQAELWRLMHQAEILVSPSFHDGTPNSLLEGMAAGCFPVTGATESMREWFDDGANGLLYPPAVAGALASALLRAAGDEPLRRAAAQTNRKLVEERASRKAVLPRIADFYRQVLDHQAAGQD